MMQINKAHYKKMHLVYLTALMFQPIYIFANLFIREKDMHYAYITIALLIPLLLGMVYVCTLHKKYFKMLIRIAFVRMLAGITIMADLIVTKRHSLYDDRIMHLVAVVLILINVKFLYDSYKEDKRTIIKF